MDDESVYRDNDGLCGAPLMKVCPRDEQHPDMEGQDGDFWNGGEPNEGNLDTHYWFSAGLGPGFTIGFLGFCSALHFEQSWTYFQAIDRTTQKLMMSGTITTLLFKRASQVRTCRTYSVSTQHMLSIIQYMFPCDPCMKSKQFLQSSCGRQLNFFIIYMTCNRKVYYQIRASGMTPSMMQRSRELSDSEDTHLCHKLRCSSLHDHRHRVNSLCMNRTLCII